MTTDSRASRHNAATTAIDGTGNGVCPQFRKMGSVPYFQTTRRTFLAGTGAAGVVLAATPAWAQLAAGEPAAAPAAPAMPPAPQDGTTDMFHGIAVPDPFRPLEDSTRADVRAWIAVQDRQGRAYLESLPSRQKLRQFFDSLLDYSRTSIPAQSGARYFSFFNNGLANQASYGFQEPLASPMRTVIDASTLSSDGTVAITGAFPDRRGARVAYLLSEAGSDKQTLRVRDIDSGRDLQVQLGFCKHTSVAWFFNNGGFFYTRYPTDNEPKDWDRHSHVVCQHSLAPGANERVIFRLPAHRNVYLRVRPSYDARLLTITAWLGTSEKAGYYVAPFDDVSQVTEIIAPGVTGFDPTGNIGATHYAITNLDAPKWRLVRIDQSDPKPERWHTVIPESELTLDRAAVFDSRLVIKHLDNLNSRVTIYDLGGRKFSSLDFGGGARVSFGRHNRFDDHLLVEVEERQRPSRIEWLDIFTRKSSVIRPTAAKHNLSDLVFRDVSATSRDGTRVPITLVHRPGIALDGSNRTLLYAYGGFGIPIWPGYNAAIAAWVRAGGIYATAVIRGGGEFGQPWHDGGRLTNKQNSFNDFIAAAEWLIAQGFTKPERLGINGASNGGLLVLSCMLQRPELYGAVVAGVPVADMLRFKEFTFGSDWMPEYGNPATEAHFKALMAYSPLHNVRKDVKYPPLLVLTADSDDRVAPAHTYKFVATLQSQSPGSEVRLKVETRAGHGFGNALNKSLDRATDTLAFLCEKLGGPMLELPKIAS
jgi:prolyl oligopeptidase